MAEAFGSGLGFEKEFLLDEIAHARSPSDRLDDHADPDAPTFDRRGRGADDEQALRRMVLDSVAHSYVAWKEERGLDWGDLVVRMAALRPPRTYDIALIDEVQDSSTSQVRAVVRHLSESRGKSAALLHPKGGGYFRHAERHLRDDQAPGMTAGRGQVAPRTLHSAKRLGSTTSSRWGQSSAQR